MKKLEGFTVLIVDDEPDLAEIVSDEFQFAGAKTIICSNGKSAFEIVQTQPVDLVVSDIRMPGGDGIELLKNIKAYNPNKPEVILVTGFSDYSIQDAYNQGACAMFPKPCDLSILVETASIALLDRKRRFLRQFERLPTDFLIDIRVEGNRDFTKGKVVNIGRGGMYVALLGELPSIGQRIYFKISELTPNEGLEGLAICRWVRLQSEGPGLLPGAGSEFEFMSNKSLETLENYLATHKPTAYIPKK